MYGIFFGLHMVSPSYFRLYSCLVFIEFHNLKMEKLYDKTFSLLLCLQAESEAEIRDGSFTETLSSVADHSQTVTIGKT